MGSNNERGNAPLWRSIDGLDVALAALAGVSALGPVATIAVRDSPLSELEAALFQSISVLFAAALAFRLALKVERLNSEQRIQQFGRAALRRVTNLRTGIARTRLHIDEVTRAAAGQTDLDTATVVRNRGLREIDALLIEQQATADGAVQDWSDVIPEARAVVVESQLVDEVQGIRDQIDALTTRAGAAEGQNEQLTARLKTETERLEAKLAKRETELAEARSRVQFNFPSAVSADYLYTSGLGSGVGSGYRIADGGVGSDYRIIDGKVVLQPAVDDYVARFHVDSTDADDTPGEPVATDDEPA